MTCFVAKIVGDNLKHFLRTLFDYGDIIYDQPQNESFCEKLQFVQYKSALAITGALQGTSHDKIYQEFQEDGINV